jgi:coproporphyrinogen III oxidase-like Fe-S oxidoreductase
LTPESGDGATLPPGDGEEIDAATAAAEEIILGLRTAHGISRGCALSRADEMAWAHEAGLVEDAPDERVRLTLRGRLLSNELFARLV